MLAHRRTVAPRAAFVIGQAERLPFPAGSFDLVAAAGSLHYADLSLALAEVARVLKRDGTFLAYDFSDGGRSVGGELAGWFASFEQRSPWPAGWQPVDVRGLPLAAYGLRLVDYTDVEIPQPMTLDTYLRYMLGETTVEHAIARGACTAEDARDWSRRSLRPVFEAGDVTVVVAGYLARLGIRN